MNIKLLTEYHLEFLCLKETAQAHPSIHLSKGHIVGNLMSLMKSAVTPFNLFNRTMISI